MPNAIGIHGRVHMSFSHVDVENETSGGENNLGKLFSPIEISRNPTKY